jgi:hypothetical protein
VGGHDLVCVFGKQQIANLAARVYGVSLLALDGVPEPDSPVLSASS